MHQWLEYIILWTLTLTCCIADQKCREIERGVVVCDNDFRQAVDIANVPTLILRNCSSISFSHGDTDFKPFSTVHNFTIDCRIDDLPYGIADYFPNLEFLNIPQCGIKKLRWQNVYTKELIIADVSRCPITCSCDHLWLMPASKFIRRVRPPWKLSRCRPDCHHGMISLPNDEEKFHVNVGDDLVVRANIIDPTLNYTFDRPYFEVLDKPALHAYEENIHLDYLELIIRNVTEADVGVIGFRCWHCVDYLIQTIEIYVDVPIVVYFIKSAHGDTDILVIQGSPLDQLNLTISTEDNRTETQTLQVDHEYSFFFRSLGLRTEPAKTTFYRRVFHVFSKDNHDGDHLTGVLTFMACTPLNCDSAKKYINHMGPPPRPTTTKLPKMERKLNKINVIVFIVLILILILIALVFYFRKCVIVFLRERIFSLRKRFAWNREVPSRRASRATEETLLRLEERSSLSSSDYTNQIIPFIDIGNITIHEKIGKGAFGEVYCGSWEKLGARSVAVKTIKQADNELEKEALVLSRLDHPNIVRLHGMTRDNGTLLLVFEMMNLGDLRAYLRGRVPQSSSYSQFPPALTETELKKIVVDITSGVCYLVAQQIVHRDLAARNCLVSGKSDLRSSSAAQRPPISVKISDFGMSRRLYSDSDYYRMEHHSLLPVRWLPPEALTDHKFSHMSDIWSLGITMWEVFSYGQIPFSELSNNEVVSYAVAGMRPQRSELCPLDMYNLMIKCWELDPEKRIQADEILLDEALQSVQPVPQKEDEEEAVNNDS